MRSSRGAIKLRQGACWRPVGLGTGHLVFGVASAALIAALTVALVLLNGLPGQTLSGGAATPTPCPRLQSAGLGLTRERWEARVGQPIAATSTRPNGGVHPPRSITVALYHAPLGRYEARFADGILGAIHYQLAEGVALTLDEARAAIAPLLPADATLTARTEADWGTLIREQYRSTTLTTAPAGQGGGQGRDCPPPEGARPGTSIAVVYALGEHGLVAGSIGLLAGNGVGPLDPH